jgi:NitT/TauT family transport system permease protein
MDLNPAERVHFEAEPRRSTLADVALLVLILVGIFSLIEMGGQWHQPFQRKLDINMSPWYLPFYTLLSFSRGAIAYGLSFIFTLFYARWAAYDRTAEKFLIPLLDILQSLPLSAFLAPIELGLVALFPHSELGVELACIIIIFTGQVWNMTFSFYYSLKALPDDFRFVGKLARFTNWQRFTQIELPFATKGLVYNSMVSMAGGWFFLSIIEAFTLNSQDYRVRGLGSYMSVAQEQGNTAAVVWDVVAMLAMIVALDQLVWRPLLVWSNKFKLEDTEAQYQDRSAVLDYLGRSRLAGWIHARGTKWMRRSAPPVPDAAIGAMAVADAMPKRVRWWHRIPWSKVVLAVALALGGYGAFKVAGLLTAVKAAEWLVIAYSLGLTLVRVLAAVAISTVIAVPVGVWIGSSPKLSRYLMPVTQIAASFPSPFIFPNLLALIFLVHGNLEWGSVVLMIVGPIWYILFNVISGASAVPQDLRSCTLLTHLTPWQSWRTLWLPGIFPALTTGWITAAGGAWNVSIACEYIPYQGKTLMAHGLGAVIQNAMDEGNYSVLAASVMAMALFVVIFNRFVWKRLSALAQQRFQLIT